MSFVRGKPGQDLSLADARDIALRYLSRREYSCLELKRKLVQRGVNEHDAEETVTACESEGLVSDQRFTEMYLRYRFNSLFGPMKIRAELRSRGIDAALISEAMSEYDEQWGESAATWVSKRSPSEWTQREKARLYRSAQNRGFTHEQVMRAIDNAQSDDKNP